MKTEKSMAKAGEFLREYGKQYFIVASEALNIGRIKFDMVPVGKAGQNNISFYVTAEQMLALCKEIISGAFAKKIAADTNSYPSAYKYTTGTDGSLHLNIGGGKVGCRIQMQDAAKKLSYVMAVSMESLLAMARKYVIYTGLEPVTPNTYYAEMIAAFEEGRKDRSKYRSSEPSDESIYDSVDANSVVDESVEPKAEKKDTPEVEKKEESKATKSTDAAKSTQNAFKVNIKSPKTLKNGFYSFDGKLDNGEEVSLLFRKDDVHKISWFKAFEAKSESGVVIDVLGEKKDNFILYSGVPKKSK